MNRGYTKGCMNSCKWNPVTVFSKHVFYVFKALGMNTEYMLINVQIPYKWKVERKQGMVTARIKILKDPEDLKL